ncbi:MULTISPECIES: hypothetical protein [Roseobacteraceae]|uniref:4Fe-4S ferredoxin-type domain-containing protein n=1 Tax=Falsiruegeria litorea TaxID=1280831 RepID=A0ABS5WTH3_9RHOB|nr:MULTISPECIES: hypothetical protein [Roseobacteraceae]MBT3142021.1 hypothetical protein [Falsiruegeria litorea]MBT8168633.1 hypothetical protein [Falsiruegeria litorea]
MEIQRGIATAPRTTQVGQDIANLSGPCVGCTECKGVCLELIEALTLPDILLRRDRNT